MLEPYAVKVASTVLRRGRVGNCSFLFDYEAKVSRTVLRRGGGSNLSFLFGDIVIFSKFESDAQDALKRAKEILEGELKLKLSPEKTKIIHARKKGVEFLGFHFNGRWRRPKDKAKKKFKEEIKRRTRRQQPVNIETVIRFLNPVIRGWGNYFKGGTVKTLFGELDGYIRGRLRSFKAKKRTWGTILYTLPQSELKKMGLVSLSSMLDDTTSCKGKSQTKAVYGKTVRTV